MLPANCFLYSLVLCTSSALGSLSWFSCILVFVFTYNTQKQTSMTSAGFFFVLCILSVLLRLVCPWFPLLSLLYNTHHTNIHVSGGIRTRNPSKREAADPRLTPLGYSNRHPPRSFVTNTIILLQMQWQVTVHEIVLTCRVMYSQ